MYKLNLCISLWNYNTIFFYPSVCLIRFNPTGKCSLFYCISFPHNFWGTAMEVNAALCLITRSRRWKINISYAQWESNQQPLRLQSKVCPCATTVYHKLKKKGNIAFLELFYTQYYFQFVSVVAETISSKLTYRLYNISKYR